MNGDWEAFDDAAIEASLKILSPERGIAWSYDDSVTPEELLTYRLKQKAYLARYGRQSVFEWEDREVEELDDFYEQMAEIIKGENALVSVNEES